MLKHNPGTIDKAISYLENDYLKQKDLPLSNLLLQSLDKILESGSNISLADLLALYSVRYLAADGNTALPEKSQIDEQLLVAFRRTAPHRQRAYRSF